MPSVEERKLHKSHVLYCEDEAVAASTRYERECSEIESTVEPFLDTCVRYYDEFRMWEAQVDRYWAQNPDSFDEDTFDAIQTISQKWQNVFRVITDLLDVIKRSKYQVRLPTATDVRARYRTMISIELMDNSPLPKHLSEMAGQATEDYNAGKVEEVVRG